MSEDIEDNDSPPDERRLALQRLLRRRNRRYKDGANSGESVKSWAEYSRVTFTPSSDSSPWQRAGLATLLIVGLLLPIWAITVMDGHERRWDDMPFWIWGIYILVGVVMAIAAMTITMVIVTSMWRLYAVCFSRIDKSERHPGLDPGSPLSASQCFPKTPDRFASGMTERAIVTSHSQ